MGKPGNNGGDGRGERVQIVTITSFVLQPTLSGTLLELRPLRAEDYDALFAVASDPLIWEQHPDSDRWQPDVLREFFRIAVGVHNVRSQRAVEKIGGVRVGTRLDPRGRESVIFQITNVAAPR